MEVIWNLKKRNLRLEEIFFFAYGLEINYKSEISSYKTYISLKELMFGIMDEVLMVAMRPQVNGWIYAEM